MKWDEFFDMRGRDDLTPGVRRTRRTLEGLIWLLALALCLAIILVHPS